MSLFITRAEAAPLVGSTVVSGTLILAYVQDVMPIISYIGITCGAILATHGVIELTIRHIKWFKKYLNK